MPRGKLLFKERDLTRAMKAARVAGFSFIRVEIDSLGKIAIVAATPHEVELITKAKDQTKCDPPKKVYD